MRFLITLLCALLLASNVPRGAAVPEVQSKCANLVYKWLTDLLEIDQIIQVCDFCVFFTLFLF
jgi:hypothetical protein